MASQYDLFKNGKIVSPILPTPSIFALLTGRAKQYPDGITLTFVDIDKNQTSTLTNQAFLDIVLRIAYMLKHTYGFHPGDAIALNLHNAPEILLFHCAAWMCGCVTVPLDLKRDDVDRKIYKMTATKTKLLVSVDDEESGMEIRQFRKALPKLKILTFQAEKGIESVISTEKIDKEELSENPDKTALVLFTSGTTALPKGVQLSFANILYNADGINVWLKITKHDVFHVVLPLHHINSTTFCISTLLAGGSIVLVSRYSKSRFWEIIAKHGCTITSIVPTICFDQLSEQSNYTKYKKQLKLSRIQIGSAPVQPTDAIAFMKLYAIPLIQGYGLTETALRIAGFQTDGLTDAQYKKLIAENTIGDELRWNNLAILHEDGSEAKENEEGEICARGPVITKGYLDNEKANTEAFTHGWFHTGDLGYWKTMYKRRFFFTNGRSKEIIIKGGVNISPLTIENAIVKQYPEIASCYAVPYPDERYGEEIGVVISLKEGSTQEAQTASVVQLQKDIEEGKISGISAYEHPSFVVLAPFDLLPKTSTGKIQRVVIKQYLADMLTPIAETSTHLFRKIAPFDTNLLREIVEIHNTRWGKYLGIDLQTATKAAELGIVIGGISKKTGEIEGSVFCEQLVQKDLEKPAEYVKTYAAVTGNLSLKPHTPTGDALLFVSISTKGRKKKSAPMSKKMKLEVSKMDQYLKLNIDPVLTFHQKAKGELKGGAEVLHILPNARPEDLEAGGYNVLMKYPTLPNAPRLHEKESLGIQLIEASFVYAVQQHVYQAYAYSRPAGFAKWMQKET